MIKEIWKDVKGYEWIYKVSSYGRVKSLDRTVPQKDGKKKNIKGKILNPRKSKKGYLKAGLNLNGKEKLYSIHRLVAIAFIPNPENKTEVNHKNGIKTDNRSSELEWATSSENNKHAFKIGLQNNSGDNNPQSKLSKNDVLEIRELILNHSNKNIGKMFKVSAATISDIKTRKTWRCV